MQSRLNLENGIDKIYQSFSPADKELFAYNNSISDHYYGNESTAKISYIYKHNNIPIAFIIARRYQKNPEWASLVYGIDYKYRHKGISNILISKIIDKCLGAGVSHLEAKVSPDNKSSIKLLENHKFSKVSKDLYIKNIGAFR